MFQELSKTKPLFLGNIVEMLGIWHLFQCNLVNWDWRVQNKHEFAKNLGAFVHDLNFNIIVYYAYSKFMYVL